jgi:hypothetical protein
MTSDLTSVDLANLQKIKKRWWQMSKKPSYYRIDYTIKFILNAANIESELWFKGARYNEQNAFQVNFESGMWKQRPKEHKRITRSPESLVSDNVMLMK